MSQREIGLIAHNYQPPREIWLRSQQKPLTIAPEWNSIIYDNCYKNILENSVPEKGFIFSLYGTLREWMMRERPDGFAKIRRNISDFSDKTSVLGDSYLHDILPLLPNQDQRLLIKVGKEAFREDLGFYPTGFWFPEAAVNRHSLGNISSEGYEYTILGSHQLTNTSNNPMWVNLSNGKEIAIIHFDTGLSGKYSYKDSVTENGDRFLTEHCPGEGICLFASDGELFNHHKLGRHYFRDYVLNGNTLSRHGIKPFDVKSAISRTRENASLNENTSWSCTHGLGRWTGEEKCFCDEPTSKTKAKKRELFTGLTRRNDDINLLLDRAGNNWRDTFLDVFLLSRSTIFSGNDFISDFYKTINRKYLESEKKLFLGKLYNLIGLTSCGWFFGQEDRIERQIPEKCLEEVNSLLETII